jgi:hypothetical protein
MQVTTLVPAYRPKVLFELLSSLRRQSVKPAAIVFSGYCARMPAPAWATPAAEAQFLDAWSAFAP